MCDGWQRGFTKPKYNEEIRKEGERELVSNVLIKMITEGYQLEIYKKVVQDRDSWRVKCKSKVLNVEHKYYFIVYVVLDLLLLKQRSSWEEAPNENKMRCQARWHHIINVVQSGSGRHIMLFNSYGTDRWYCLDNRQKIETINDE